MKVLFVGLGGVGQRHLRVLKKINPAAEIFALRTRGRSYEITDTMQLNKEVNIEGKYNISLCKGMEDAISKGPDFAIVATPTSLHISVAMELVRNNIPVLVEKPISNIDEGVDALVDLSIQNNTLVMPAYMMRFNPCAIEIKNYIKRKVIGNIYSISINVNSYFPGWHGYEKYNEFYAGRSDLGGGVVLTESHEIDLLNQIFGMPKSLYAVGGKRSSLEIDVEDNVSVLMKYVNDSEGFEFAVTLNMSFVQKTPLRKFQLFGEHGNIYWDILGNTVGFNNYTNEESDLLGHDNFDRNDMFENQLINFISLINKKIQIDQMTNDFLGTHKITMAIKQSIDSDCLITF